MGKRGNGEGSIYRRKDGRWVGQYLVYTAEGAKYRYLYGKTRQEVSKKLTKAMADRDGGLNLRRRKREARRVPGSLAFRLRARYREAEDLGTGRADSEGSH